MTRPPENWIKLEGASTAPIGKAWYSNGKSRFSTGYESALFDEVEDTTIDEDKSSGAKALRTPPTTKVVGIRAGDSL